MIFRGRTAVLLALLVAILVIPSIALGFPDRTSPIVNPLGVKLTSPSSHDRMTLLSTCRMMRHKRYGGCRAEDRRDRGGITVAEGETLQVDLPEAAVAVRANRVVREKGNIEVFFIPAARAAVVPNTDGQSWRFVLPNHIGGNALVVQVRYERPIRFHGVGVTAASYVSRMTLSGQGREGD